MSRENCRNAGNAGKLLLKDASMLPTIVIAAVCAFIGLN